MKKLRLAILALCIATLLGGACAGKKVDENDPTSLLEDAEEDIKGEHFSIALEKLRMIKNRFPYAKVAVDATLRIADVYFLQESYTEAAASYELFRDLHPKHEKVPYALFRAAKSYYKDMPSNVSRDMAAGFKAQDAYESFLKRFPAAAEAPEATADLGQVKKALGEKEVYVGKFYEREGYKYSARPRYKKTIQVYPDSEPAKEAQARLKSIGETAPPNEEPTPDGHRLEQKPSN